MKGVFVGVAVWGLVEVLGAQNLRVTFEIVEVPHGDLVALTHGGDSGHRIHHQVNEWVDAGKARIIETGILSGRSGERFVIESIAEVIYPTEPEPSGLGGVPSDMRLDSTPVFPVPIRTLFFTCFETRNIGVTLEVAPSLEDHLVDLNTAVEIVGREASTEWKTIRDAWGEVASRRPTFRAHQINQSVTVVDGRYELLAVLNPEPVAVPAIVKRWLVFVRAEILRLPPKD